MRTFISGQNNNFDHAICPWCIILTYIFRNWWVFPCISFIQMKSWLNCYISLYLCVLFCFVLSSEVLYLSIQNPHCRGITTIQFLIRLTIHTTTFVVALSLPFNLFGDQRCKLYCGTTTQISLTECQLNN